MTGSPRATIGRFTSRTLAGQDMTVPDDLVGPTLVCFAYEQRQQRDVDSWLAVVAGDDRVAVLEVPVLGRRWRPARAFIDGGMASNMDAATRAQTMCVYTDVAAFRRDVLGTTSGDVAALLVTPDGTIHWSARGPAAPATSADLRQAIGSLAG